MNLIIDLNSKINIVSIVNKIKLSHFRLSNNYNKSDCSSSPLLRNCLGIWKSIISYEAFLN